MVRAIEEKTLARYLKWLAVVLFLFGILMAFLDRLMVAGVSFLGITFAIYYRETLI